MSSAEGSASFETRLLATVGLTFWLLSALCAVWEVLAQQPPDSPFHFGVLAGPITQLRSYAFALGTASLVGSLYLPRFVFARARAIALLLALGAAVELGALGFAATRGMLAVQLLDPRPDARLTLYVRALGHALLLLGLLALLVQSARGLGRARARPPG